jgi:hypothetical protein
MPAEFPHRVDSAVYSGTARRLDVGLDMDSAWIPSRVVLGCIRASNPMSTMDKDHRLLYPGYQLLA